MRAWWWSWLVVLAWGVSALAQEAPEPGPLTPPGPDLPDAGLADPKALLDDFDNAFRKMARAKNAEALEKYKAGDFPGALVALRQAIEAAPEDPEILNNAGYLYHRLGDLKQAEHYYAETLRVSPKRYVAHINLVDLILEQAATPRRLARAAKLLQDARVIKGNHAHVIRRQAQVSVRQGKTEEARRFYRELMEVGPVSDSVRLEIGEFHRGLGEVDEALEWYREIVAGGVDSPEREAARRAIREIEVERAARRFGWSGPAEDIPSQARALVARARRLLSQGKAQRAREMLEQALEQAPQYAEAHAELGGLMIGEGALQRAEVALLRAMSIDQGNPEIHARLGRLYLGIPERAGEARLFLGRALESRPDWNELNLSMADACRATGHLPRALVHVERYLAEGGSHRDRALSLKAELLRLLPDGVQIPPAQEVDPARRSVMATLKSAKALVSKGRAGEALVALQQLPEAEQGPEVLNLEALILITGRKWGEAVLPLERSLALDDTRAESHELMGQALWHLGRHEEAKAAWTRAQARGAKTAALSLARLSLEEAPSRWGALGDLGRLGALIEARAHLKAQIAGGGPEWAAQQATSLKEMVDRRLQSLVIWGALILIILAVGIVGWRRRIWGGTDLATLLARHPEVGPDVQRVLSAVRHEVIKHNTMVLTGLVGALEAGQPAGDKARHVCISLFGSGRAAMGTEAVYGRLLMYAEQLRQIGRAQRVRLNLRRRDPAFKALLSGFELLAREAADLSRVEALSPRKRDAVIRALKRAVPLINERGYAEIRNLLDQLRILEVDEALLNSIFERTVREPGFSEAVVGPLHLEVEDPLPLGVGIPRSAFEDILANLIRNAMQSGLRHGQGRDPGDGSTPVALSIGLGVRLEVDMITGLERVAFLIRDRSPQRLTSEMLRGRYIEEGLGLTADQVSRYDGTLDVVVNDGDWEKAVVVKLPRVYHDDEEEDA